mmetsp:Transcript_21411/g.61983  ORF Transcript_21411/g.61983 Transcript_21411/m.61983 type:complete len:309 (-) Transcript_21411:250-1176(-)
MDTFKDPRGQRPGWRASVLPCHVLPAVSGACAGVGAPVRLPPYREALHTEAFGEQEGVAAGAAAQRVLRTEHWAEPLLASADPAVSESHCPFLPATVDGCLPDPDTAEGAGHLPRRVGLHDRWGRLRMHRRGREERWSCGCIQPDILLRSGHGSGLDLLRRLRHGLQEHSWDEREAVAFGYDVPHGAAGGALYSFHRLGLLHPGLGHLGCALHAHHDGPGRLQAPVGAQPCCPRLGPALRRSGLCVQHLPDIPGRRAQPGHSIFCWQLQQGSCGADFPRLLGGQIATWSKRNCLAARDRWEHRCLRPV